jgi:cyclopropane fatty-acyl-phospholipid synthase-like methyltransferase
MKKYIEKFWEGQHEMEDLSSDTLTGSDPIYVLDFLNLSVEELRNKKIIDIGVGFGTMAVFLKSLGCFVCSVDISQSALTRISSISDMICHSDRMCDMPNRYFDYCISMKVFQHVPPSCFLNISTNVSSSLVVGGKFAFQYSSSYVGEEVTREEDLTGNLLQAGRVLRTPESIGNIFNTINMNPTFLSSRVDYPEVNMSDRGMWGTVL